MITKNGYTNWDKKLGAKLDLIGTVMNEMKQDSLNEIWVDNKIE